jgi:pyruvate formate lyase activating enzyme
LLNWQDNTPVNTLRLAGLQKTTLIDYPGKIGCVVFLSGCNFHCPYCHNPDLARGRLPDPISLDDLTAFLNQRQHLLDAVVISGGEPTLSPHIGDLCRSLRRLELAVKLDTNGSQPGVLARLINEGLVDYIAMDIKTTPDRYDTFTNLSDIGARITASIQCIMDHCRNYEFRTTCARPFIDETIIDEIGRMIEGAELYVLQTFQSGDLLDSDFGKNSANGYPASGMERLGQRAEAWVKQCRIR